MNELQNFNFNNLPVRTVLIAEEPWFVAKDVADILEYSETAQMTRRLDKEDSMSVKLTGMNMKSTIINESGLYEAIIGSKKKEVKPFKRWITHEVLPMIRKTGNYQAKPQTSNLSPELQMFNQLFQASANVEIEQKRQAEELETVKNSVGAVEKSVDNISEIVALSTSDWRKQSQAIIRKIAYKLGAGTAYQEIGKQIYQETERAARCSLKIRLTNMRKTMALEGASKSSRDKKNYLDVIDKDPKLVNIYMHTVKQFAIKYQVDVA